MKKTKNKILTMDQVNAKILDQFCASARRNVVDLTLVALSRRCEDITTELHALGNELHKAGLHRQATAADVAVGILEDITEDLKNGG